MSDMSFESNQISCLIGTAHNTNRECKNGHSHSHETFIYMIVKNLALRKLG